MLCGVAPCLPECALPAEMRPTLQADVPAAVRQGLEVLPCKQLEDVLRGAFDPPLDLEERPPLARL